MFTNYSQLLDPRSVSITFTGKIQENKKINAHTTSQKRQQFIAENISDIVIPRLPFQTISIKRILHQHSASRGTCSRRYPHTCHLHSTVPSEPENWSFVATISVSFSAVIGPPQLPSVAPVERRKTVAAKWFHRSMLFRGGMMCCASHLSAPTRPSARRSHAAIFGNSLLFALVTPREERESPPEPQVWLEGPVASTKYCTWGSRQGFDRSISADRVPREGLSSIVALFPRCQIVPYACMPNARPPLLRWLYTTH